MTFMEWDTVVKNLDNDIANVVKMYQKSIDILNLDPFTPSISGSIGTVSSAVKAVALSLVSLFFMMQFCNDAMYMKLRSYENVFKVIFKFFLSKALVDNADGLMKVIYKEFTNISLSVSGSTFLDGFKATDMVVKPASDGVLGLNNLTTYMLASMDILVLKGACWVISLILIGRLFEIVIYTAVAPIPLATVASDGWSDSFRTFLKGYAAVCLQAVIISIMFSAFSGISSLMTLRGSNLTITVTALSLALGVIKSGQWARTAVGMG